jgi:vacuolar-type H+-ATPase subunit H
MAKLTFTLDLDYIDDFDNLDDALRDEITDTVVSKVISKIDNSIEEEAKKKLEEKLCKVDETISERFNKIIEDFFSTPKTITDKYGDIVEKDVTIHEKLKARCDSFLTEKVDSSGNVTTGSFYNSTEPRYEYILNKIIDSSLKYEIDKIATKIRDDAKKIIETEVKSRIGDKLADLIDINSVINKSIAN